MPVVIGRDRIGKNLQWERRDRLTQTVIPKPVAKGCEEKGRRFAAHAGKCKQNPGDDPLRCGLHHNVNDRFPPAHAECERGLTISVWHQQDDFFCRAQD